MSDPAGAMTDRQPLPFWGFREGDEHFGRQVVIVGNAPALPQKPDEPMATVRDRESGQVFSVSLLRLVAQPTVGTPAP